MRSFFFYIVFLISYVTIYNQMLFRTMMLVAFLVLRSRFAFSSFSHLFLFFIFKHFIFIIDIKINKKTHNIQNLYENRSLFNKSLYLSNKLRIIIELPCFKLINNLVIYSELYSYFFLSHTFRITPLFKIFF